MKPGNRIRVRRVTEEWQRQQALSVLRATYVDEKGWVSDAEQAFPASEVCEPRVSWFLALAELEPVGVIRVLYELPLAQYAHYAFRPLGADLDLDWLLRNAHVAEIGRFAVVPAFRRNPLVVAALIREASLDTFQRGYTHYLTDVFEGERHSPYEFHTRVLGFRSIATHDTGELNCPHRRITMLLDLEAAYRRLCASRGWIYRYLRQALEPLAA
jgi:hypothetical protein